MADDYQNLIIGSGEGGKLIGWTLAKRRPAHDRRRALDDRRLLPQRSLPAKQERDLQRQGRVAGRSADRAGCDDRQRQSRHAGRRPPQAADGGRPRRTAPGQVQGQRLRTAARRSPVYSSQNSRSDPAGRRHANLARAAGLSWLGQPGDDSQRAWAGRSQTADPRRSPRIGAVARAFGDPGWRLRGFGIRTGPLRQPGLDRAARKTIARPRRSRYRRRRGTTDGPRRDRRAARLATRRSRAAQDRASNSRFAAARKRKASQPPTSWWRPAARPTPPASAWSRRASSSTRRLHPRQRATANLGGRHLGRRRLRRQPAIHPRRRRRCSGDPQRPRWWPAQSAAG